jgi:2-dehydro-3-deoxygalactonokinase
MSGIASYADWIAVDWGTTHLRAWAMAEDGTCGRRRGPMTAWGTWRGTRSNRRSCRWSNHGSAQGSDGRAGLRHGRLAAGLGGGALCAVPGKARAPRPPVACAGPAPRVSAILPGLKQAVPPMSCGGRRRRSPASSPPRRASTGCSACPEPMRNGCRSAPGGGELPHLHDRRVVRASVQRNRSCATRSPRAGSDRDAFREACRDTLSRPETLAQRLFSIRAGQLLDGTSGEVDARACRGYLIGAELAAARPYWLGQEVVVAGAPALPEVYAKALATQGVDRARQRCRPA